jgi:hypothetical protein
MQPAPKIKMAVLIWMAIYPTINLIFFVLGDFLATLPILLKTLVLTLILVPLMVFVFTPLLTKIFRKWLFKS